MSESAWPMIERCRRGQARGRVDTREARRFTEDCIALEYETMQGTNLMVQVERNAYGWGLMLKPG